ncbi:MAG: hypothetical protein WA210_21205 [Burkholderiaceae bacterium]
MDLPTAAPSVAPAPSVYVWSASLAAAARKLRGELPGSTVRLAQSTDQRLWVSLAADAVFAAGRSALKPGATPWLDTIAATLRELPGADVQIFGEPDALSRDDNTSRALALDRAASTRDWMVARGLGAWRVAVAGRRPPSGLQAQWPSPAAHERAGARSVQAQPPEELEASSDGRTLPRQDRRLDILIGERPALPR